MDVKECGQIIKSLRESRKITQVELSADICSDKELRRIEKGTSLPNLFLYERLLTKLGINLSNQLYSFASENDQLAYNKVSELRKIIFMRDYKTLDDEFKQLSTQPFFNKDDPFLLQFSLIINAILLMELHGKPDESLEYAYKAIKVTFPKFNVAEIETYQLILDEYQIINTIALIHTCLGDKDKGIDILKRLKNSINKMTRTEHIRHKMLPTICFNLSNLLGQTELYNEALFVCDEGIAVCREANTFKSLDELFYNKACCLYYLKDLSGSQKNFQDAYNTGLISNNLSKADFIKKNAAEKYGIFLKNY